CGFLVFVFVGFLVVFVVFGGGGGFLRVWFLFLFVGCVLYFFWVVWFFLLWWVGCGFGGVWWCVFGGAGYGGGAGCVLAVGGWRFCCVGLL
ncbi:hypothetical protein RA281_27785, partial [Pseudomonas syringae pv. tagetis]